MGTGGTTLPQDVGHALCSLSVEAISRGHCAVMHDMPGSKGERRRQRGRRRWPPLCSWRKSIDTKFMPYEICVMKNVTITLPEDVAAWLRVRAAEDGRSVSRWLAELLDGMRSEDAEIRSCHGALSGQEATQAGLDRWSQARRAANCMTAPVFVDTPCNG